MSSQTDRDTRLNSFREKFRKNLDDTNKELHSDIKQILSRDFEDELSNAEFSAKKIISLTLLRMNSLTI
ncbi:MAG: hypothetical protein WBE34_13850 [Candidatus Nitrosopolaris sp.]